MLQELSLWLWLKLIISYKCKLGGLTHTKYETLTAHINVFLTDILTCLVDRFLFTLYLQPPNRSHWCQRLCHCMMQADKFANHRPTDSFHWRLNTPSNKPVKCYLWIFNRKHQSCTITADMQYNEDCFFFQLQRKTWLSGKIWWIGAHQKGLRHLHWSNKKKINFKVTHCLHNCVSASV